MDTRNEANYRKRWRYLLPPVSQLLSRGSAIDEVRQGSDVDCAGVPRIRELRLAQNLSQEALGLESGLSRNMIIGIEWGKKSVAYERLWDVADALGVPAADLLSESAALPQRIPYRGGRRAMGAQC